MAFWYKSPLSNHFNSPERNISGEEVIIRKLINIQLRKSLYLQGNHYPSDSDLALLEKKVIKSLEEDYKDLSKISEKVPTDDFEELIHSKVFDLLTKKTKKHELRLFGF